MRNNSDFSLTAFEKIEDIIFLDEPILSHFKMNEKDYLLYLVDNKENSDIYLFFEVKEGDLYSYLSSSKSLKEVVLSNNFILQIEQDFNGNIVHIDYVLSSSILPKYLPIENSFIEYNPTKESYYFEKINEFKRKGYLYSLRESAFYLKFSTNSSKYGDTIGLRELTNTLLTNISSSFKNFVEIDFHKRFEKKISDNNKLKRIFNSVLPDTDLRMVALNYGSFEIGLASDKLMKTNIEDKDVKDWANNVGDSYRKIVLDEEISDNELNSIIEIYSEEERNKIFKPIVTIVDNPNYSLKIKVPDSNEFKNLGLKNKKVSNKIIVKNIIPELPNEKDLELIQVTTIIDKNSKKKTIYLDNTLFNVIDKSTIPLKYNDFISRGYKEVNTDIEILLNIENLENKIYLYTDYDGINFKVEIENDKIEDGIKKMMDKIYEYILNKI